MKFKLIHVLCLIAVITVAVVVIKTRSPEKPSRESEAGLENKVVEMEAETEFVAPQVAIQPDAPKDIEQVFDEMADAELVSQEARSVEFCGRLSRIFSGEATEDEQLAFWEEMRTSPEIRKIIAEQERKTPKDSMDVQGHMNLAELYIAKLLSASSGPEKGLWGGKAEERWRAVLEIDPNHWEAQHSVAFSLSMYPDFLNKTGEAINEYERLLIIQREQSPEPEHAQSYLELYRLYQKVGDPANALEVLDEGLGFFPDNQHLIDQRNSVSTLN